MGNIISLITKRKKTIIILLILIAGFLLARKFIFNREAELEQTQIKRGEVVEELILTGKVKADNHAELRFQSSGELTWLGVKEGDEVRKGQYLAKLDTYSLNANYEKAISSLRNAEAALAVVYDNVKDHDDDESLIQREERTTAEVVRDKAYRDFTIAQENLVNANLKAPFDGIVTQITQPTSGVNTIAAQSQITIVDPKTIYFEITADQSEIIDVYEGQMVTVILDSFQEDEIEGQIAFISYTPMSGEIGTVYQIKVAIPQEKIDSKKVRIGMSGDAHLVIAKNEAVLYIPPKFVNTENGNKFIYLDSPKNKVEVKVGLESEDRVEISADQIKDGDTVYKVKRK